MKATIQKFQFLMALANYCRESTQQERFSFLKTQKKWQVVQKLE